jgi:nucleoside-diphosphate-sugar epimerase
MASSAWRAPRRRWRDALRVLVTGATGFLGSHVVPRLLEGGHEVAAVLRPGTDPWRLAGSLARVIPVAGSLDDVAALRPRVAQFAPEAVIHTAWRGVGNRDRDDPAQWSNLPQLRDLIDLAADCGARSWIGMGSQAEYGPGNAIIDETRACAPTNLYGRAKLEAAGLAAARCAERKLRFAWLRLFSSYGPRDHGYWMIPYLILALLRGERPALTACAQRWDYLFIGDAAAAVRRVVESETAQGIFNLGSGRAVPLREIVETIRDLIDPALPIGFGEVPYRPDQVMHLEADIGRLAGATGWRPEIGPADGLGATVRWYRDNRWRYDA